MESEGVLCDQLVQLGQVEFQPQLLPVRWKAVGMGQKLVHCVGEQLRKRIRIRSDRGGLTGRSPPRASRNIHGNG
jgi:hypothetical protein